MGLRKKFSEMAENRKHARDLKRRSRVNKDLGSWAGRLSRKAEKYRRKGEVDATLPGWACHDDTKALSGYKRLHEVCAANDMQVEIRIVESFNSLGHMEIISTPYILVNPNKPYSSSVDAGIYGPAVQLKFPGL